MRRPYKYPYLTIFILGYYWLEHQGYYYKIRSWLGYAETEEISFVIPLSPESFHKLSLVPGRQLLILSHGSQGKDAETEMRKAAKKAKERKRSPVLFGSMDCEKYQEICREWKVSQLPAVSFLKETRIVDTFLGPLSKEKILKFLKKAQEGSEGKVK